MNRSDRTKKRFRLPRWILSISLLAAVGGMAFAQSQPPITILINTSPWLPSFQALVKDYEQQTGNTVNLNIVPFNAMIQKSLNAVSSSTSEYDILNLNEQWYSQFYSGGLVTPIKNIDPSYQLPSQVIEYAYADRWDPKVGASTKDGDVYGFPINGNIQLLFYRKDLFAQHNLQPPTTWADVEKDAQILNDPPNVYGFVTRTSPPNFNFQAWLHSYGGSIISLDQQTGTWSVNIDQPAALQALNEWLKLTWSNSPPNFANMGQSDEIALMASGHLAMFISASAAESNFINPDTSSVVGKVGAVVTPGPTADTRAPTSGIWVMGIPHNVPDARKMAAAKFLEWAMTKDAEMAYAKAGGVPVRQDVYEELAKDPAYGWWMQAVADSTPYIHAQVRIKETPQILAVIDRVLGQAVIKKMTAEQALQQAATDIQQIMVKGGYNVTPLSGQ